MRVSLLDVERKLRARLTISFVEAVVEICSDVSGFAGAASVDGARSALELPTSSLRRLIVLKYISKHSELLQKIHTSHVQRSL
jgi:hypothetical protein